MPEQAQTVILGAGPAGLTAAYELVKHGQSATVVEADPTYVGGIARTVRYKEFRFDIGGHRFFSKNAEVEALWREILPDEFIEVQRLSRIDFDGKFFDYPLRPANALRNLGLGRSIAAVATVREWLQEHVPNVAPAGRNGMHKYNNQDHSMMAALLTARNLVGTDARDPWNVNTDAEYHEEASAAADTAGRAVPKPVRPALPRS